MTNGVRSACVQAGKCQRARLGSLPRLLRGRLASEQVHKSEMRQDAKRPAMAAQTRRELSQMEELASSAPEGPFTYYTDCAVFVRQCSCTCLTRLQLCCGGPTDQPQR